MQDLVFSSRIIKYGALLALHALVFTSASTIARAAGATQPGRISPAPAIQFAEAKEQILHVGNGAEIKDADPTKATGIPESHVIENLFEGLTAHDPLTLAAIPGVAQSWQISADGKIYTFHLRKNARWSDGTGITARDFVYSWQRAVAPETASEYAYQLYCLKNGKEINTGTTKDLNALGVKALDDYTLEVSLNHPVPYFLHLTSFHTYFPTPQHVIKKFSGNGEWTRAGNMVSNGPFKLSEWILNKHIKLEPNPYYWDKEAVKLSAVYIHPIENVDTEEKSFWAGELHMTLQVPLIKVPSYLDEARKNPRAYHPYKMEPYLGTYFYRFNTSKPPFNDKRVRRAFTISINRQLLIDKVTRHHEIPADSLCPPGLDGYDFPGTLQATVSKETLAEAQELMSQAGYPHGKGFPNVSILYNTLDNHKKIALAVRQMWKDSLGVEVGLFNQEWKVYLDTQRKMQYEISRAGWIGDYPDPNTFLDMFVTNGANNQTGWANKEYDRLIEQAANTSEHKARLDLFRQAETILMDELPIAPVYIHTNTRLVSEKVKLVIPHEPVRSWHGNLTDRLLFKYYALAK